MQVNPSAVASHINSQTFSWFERPVLSGKLAIKSESRRRITTKIATVFSMRLADNNKIKIVIGAKKDIHELICIKTPRCMTCCEAFPLTLLNNGRIGFLSCQ